MGLEFIIVKEKDTRDCHKVGRLEHESLASESTTDGCNKS